MSVVTDENEGISLYDAVLNINDLVFNDKSLLTVDGGNEWVSVSHRDYTTPFYAEYNLLVMSDFDDFIVEYTSWLTSVLEDHFRAHKAVNTVMYSEEFDSFGANYLDIDLYPDLASAVIEIFSDTNPSDIDIRDSARRLCNFINGALSQHPEVPDDGNRLLPEDLENLYKMIWLHRYAWVTFK